MRRSRLFAAALLGAGLLLTAAPAADKNAEAAKAGLSKLSEFIGVWKGTGESKAGGKAAGWKENLEWGWKFPKETPGDAYLALDVSDGKNISKGALRYDPAKKVYTFDVTDKAGNDLTYTGKLTPRGELELSAKTKAGDVRKLKLSTIAGGARMVVQSELQAGGRGLAQTEYKVTVNKEGESFAGGGGKKNECVVTGGLGTIPVSFMGKTYYVCCSGCREEFAANPKKYVDEFEKGRK